MSAFGQFENCEQLSTTASERFAGLNDRISTVKRMQQMLVADFDDNPLFYAFESAMAGTINPLIDAFIVKQGFEYLFLDDFPLPPTCSTNLIPALRRLESAIGKRLTTCID
jgi:hypothetical protein